MNGFRQFYDGEYCAMEWKDLLTQISKRWYGVEIRKQDPLSYALMLCPLWPRMEKHQTNRLNPLQQKQNECTQKKGNYFLLLDRLISLSSDPFRNKLELRWNNEISFYDSESGKSTSYLVHDKPIFSNHPS